MKTQREYIDINHSAADRIHQTVLIGNAAAPKAMLFTLQRLWLADSCKRMFKNVCKQSRNSLHDSLVASTLPISQILVRFGKKLYFHKSSSLTVRPRPSSISFCPWRMTSAIAGEDIKYSVSSIACFLAVNFLRYFTAFFIRFSSSAMMLNSRNNSAFSSNAVISSLLFVIGCKNSHISPIIQTNKLKNSKPYKY